MIILKPFIISLLASVVCLSGTGYSMPGAKNGKLFLVAGQSNAVGVGDKNTSIKLESGTAFEFNSETVEFIHLQDPVGSSHLGFQKAEDGSFIPAFAKAFHHQSREKVYVAQAAKGGSACHAKAETNDWGNWSKTGGLFLNSVKKARMAEKKSGLKLSAIIWSQGENDGIAIANNIITKDDYKKALEDLILRYRAEFGKNIPFCIIETGRHTSTAPDSGFNIVRHVQREVANADSNTFIVYSKTDKFTEYNLLSDPVHYCQEALNDIGNEIANNIYAILNGRALKPNPGVMIIAHRGASGFAPENTLAAVNLAWEMGATAVEIDIHLSSDNKVVVCHDSDTERTSGTKLIIADTPSAKLRKLDVGSTFSPEFSGEKIPFLSEVLETVPHGKFLFIEIKCNEDVAPYLKHAIDNSGKKNQVKIISFSETALKKAKGLMPDIPVFWLVCPPYKPGVMKELITRSDSNGFNGLDVNYGLLNNESDKVLKESNRFVYTWTVNKKEDAAILKNYNVYGITTDNPHILY